MQFKFLILLGSFIALPLAGWAQDAMTSQTSSEGSTSGALQASNILNPNISVISWLQAEAGHRKPGPGDADESGNAFQMKETEVAFQSMVDSWARADFFVSIGQEKVELEEGYLTWFRLPAALALKVGKFKTNFGRFNRIHTPETPFADRPLFEQNYFGEDGLSGPGGSLSWQIPNPWLFMNLDVEAITAPTSNDIPAFDRRNSKDIVGVTRLSAFYDLSESWNVNVGGDYSYGPAGVDFNPLTASSSTLHTQLYGADITFRWKNIRRSIYRSFLWSTEALWSKHDMTSTSTVDSHGMFSYMDLQFAQRWHSGIRYDYSQFPTDGHRHEQGGLTYVTYYPSEFTQLSLQGRHIKRADGANENLAFLKVTFNIGPHGAHPF